MQIFINLLRPIIVVSFSFPVNIVIFIGIFLSSVFNLRKWKYELAQISAKMLLFLSGVKIESFQKNKKLNPSNAYYLGNFIGIEILPALISVINEPTCLILRWFNFYTPIFGWSFYLLKFIPFSNNFAKVENLINRRITIEGFSVINFPAGYNILHRKDSKSLFKSVSLRPFKEKIKIIPFAVIEREVIDSIWFRSSYTISFLDEELFDPLKSKITQIKTIEDKVRKELFNLTEGD
ncbi:hypothetical protein AB3N58_06840 [Leptospira sp. WS60.C2]